MAGGQETLFRVACSSLWNFGLFFTPPPENYQYTVLESLPVRSVVAKIKATDADIGSNAEMDYRIMDSDGAGMFNVTTDEDTQDGVITLLKVITGWTLLQMIPLAVEPLCSLNVSKLGDSGVSESQTE